MTPFMPVGPSTPSSPSTASTPSTRFTRSTPIIAARLLSLVLVLALAGGAAGCAMEADRSGDVEPVAELGEASVMLRQLADEVWERQLEQDVFLRLREGLAIERLPDVSHGQARADADFARSVLERLELIDLEDLDHQERLSWEILRWQSEMGVEGFDYFWHGSVLTPYSSPLPNLRRIFAAHRFEDAFDLDAYVALVEQVPAFVDELQARARGQLERGIVVPQPGMPAAIGIVEATIRPAGRGPFAVADERLAGLELGDEEAAAFHGRVAAIVNERINPALQRLRDFLAGEYRAAAPAEVGASQYPDGENGYRYLVRLHTTMDVTPEQVQRTGERMVAEMEAAMAGIREQIGWEGTAAEFHAYLRSDPRFFPKSPDEVARRLMEAAETFEARIHDFFLETPEAAYGVQRLDPSLEAGQTYGYYQWPQGDDARGYYNYNGSRLDERSWLNMVGLALHELIPGHHFQIARQFENEELHDFRRAALHTAYTEGWGSYASYLGQEAGLYDDPYSHYGYYAMEIFLANRLVVDPGTNAFDWPLQRARQYMREHTLESDTQIATETLRYSTDMPGQALGYQMGKRKILELRALAEEALGDAFDLRRFHEAVVGSGSMPMTVLEQHIDWWIQQERDR